MMSMSKVANGIRPIVGSNAVRAMGTAVMQTTSVATAKAIEVEEKYGAHNYHPIPVVINRAKGVHMWDVEGKVK